MKKVGATAVLILLFLTSVFSSGTDDGEKPVSTELGEIESNEKAENDELNSTINRQIIWGWPVRPNQVPFQCMLRYSSSRCGCAIIHPQLVITAAHCIPLRPENGTVTAGMVEQTDARAVTREIKVALVHPDYDSNNILSSDLAIIKLNASFPQGRPDIAPIELTTDTIVPHRYDWNIVYASGWGVTDMRVKQISHRLMMGMMQVLPESFCSGMIGSNTSKIICTRSLPSTVCSGDSGGPVFKFDLRKFKFELVAVVSFGEKNCSLAYPAGHTYLGAYRTWIRRTTIILATHTN